MEAAGGRRRHRGRRGREWIVIIAVALIAHLVFFILFKAEYLEIFRSEQPGNEGTSDYILLDRPFSLIPYPELPEPSAVPEPVTTDAIEHAERSILDEIAEPSSYVEPMRGSAGGGSTGRPGPRRTAVEPKPLFIPWPSWPDGVPENVKGSVELLLYVDEEGIVREVRVNRGLPYEALNRTAIDAARRIRFVPGEEKGVPTAMWVRLSIGFQPR